jgi:transcriptional regulator with XRE-family HTH domain
MTQTDFAESVGTSASYISMVVNGRRSSISGPLAFLIEEKYGYSADWMLHNEGEKKVCPFETRGLYKNLKTNISKLSLEDITKLFGFILLLEENEETKKTKRDLKKQNRSSA